MKKILCLCLLLTGCGSIPYLSDDEPIIVETKPIVKNTTRTVKYYDDPIIKNVNHYAKWLTQDLFANIDFPSNSEVFVVSDLALLDSDLDKTNHFGRQMTEAMIHEVNRTGFSVIDIKTSGFIRMTEEGDLFFQTKDHREIVQKTDATNIITGTMTRHRGGYLVNARVVALESRALVSSAQIFVPYDVVDAVMRENSITSTSGSELDQGLPIKAYSSNNK